MADRLWEIRRDGVLVESGAILKGMCGNLLEHASKESNARWTLVHVAADGDVETLSVEDCREKLKERSRQGYGFSRGKVAPKKSRSNAPRKTNPKRIR